MATAEKTSINLSDVSNRLRGSSVAAAERASTNLTSGLGVLHHHLQRPKNAKWQGESSFILDGLRFTAKDGLDLQKVLGHTTEGERDSDELYLNKACRQAKQALLSTASPLAAAAALSKNLDPFVAKCLEVIENLKSMIEIERHEQNHGLTEQSISRATPKDNSSPSKKGV